MHLKIEYLPSARNNCCQFTLGGRVVLLIAIVLGIAFAWLTENGCNWFAKELESNQRWQKLSGKKQLRAKGKEAGYILLLLVFVAAAGILVGGIYGRYAGELGRQEVRTLYFLTQPTSLAAIIGFVTGAAIFWWRDKLEQLFSKVYSALHRSPPKQRKVSQSGSGDGAREPYPWLMGIVGIAAVTLVSIVTIIVFFPDVLSRVESIKIAGLEARFAASASQSVRVMAQARDAQFSTNDVLNKWSKIDQTFESVIDPTRLILIESGKLNESESNDRNKWPRNFLTAFAMPLAEVMACYSSDFAVRGTVAQAKLAPLTVEWRNFAIQIFATKPADQIDTFNRLTETLRTFIVFVDEDLSTRKSHCGLPSKTSEIYGSAVRDAKDPLKPDNTKDQSKLENTKRRDLNYFRSANHTDLVKGMEKELAHIFSNGYVIGFIADMIMFTQTRDHAIQFLDAMAKHLQRGDDTLPAQANFFRYRAAAKYDSQYWNFKDYLSDVQQARKLAKRIADTLGSSAKSQKSPPTSSAKRLQRYYDALVARSVNDIIYGHVRDWLEGRRISPLEFLDMEELAKQQYNWLREQSYTGLLATADEIGSNQRVIYIGSIYDTLALYELMVAATQAKLTADVCGKSWALLTASKNVFEALRPTIGEDEYRGVVSTLNAHENIYGSACQP